MSTTAEPITNGHTNGTSHLNGTSDSAATTAKKPTNTPTYSSGGMNYYPSAISSTLPILSGPNAFLGDVVSTLTPSSPVPLTCGFFRLEPGPALDYTYTYHETKIILAGEFTITEMATGKEVKAGRGDVFYFADGARIKFENRGEEEALAFFTGGRKVEKMVE